MDVIPLVAIIVLVVAVAGLLLLNWRTARHKSRLVETQRRGPQDVQCPACLRWQAQTPRESTFDEAARLANESTDREVTYVNNHRCVFCGHQWDEEYLF